MEKIIAFDFDGVIAEYDGWRGPDIFGKPIKKTIEVIKQLKKIGHTIIIWTCRKKTEKLESFLKNIGVEYDSINDTSHNPPGTSEKPVYDVLVDDRAINFKPGIDLLSTINEVLSRKDDVCKSHIKNKDKP